MANVARWAEKPSASGTRGPVRENKLDTTETFVKQSVPLTAPIWLANSLLPFPLHFRGRSHHHFSRMASFPPRSQTDFLHRTLAAFEAVTQWSIVIMFFPE